MLAVGRMNRRREIEEDVQPEPEAVGEEGDEKNETDDRDVDVEAFGETTVQHTFQTNGGRSRLGRGYFRGCLTVPASRPALPRAATPGRM